MHLLLLAAGLVAAAPAPAATIALRCGDVFDSKSAALVGARTIVVTDGRIREVLPGGAPVPGAREVDLAGQTCMPGWIDLHVHLSQESNPKSYEERFRLDDTDFAFRAVGYADKTLRAGFTTVRDPGGEVAVKLRNAIDQGHVPGPRIHAAGKSIATTGGPPIRPTDSMPGCRTCSGRRGRPRASSTARRTRGRPCASGTRTVST